MKKCSYVKNLLFSIFLLLFAISVPLAVYTIRNIDSLDSRSRASSDNILFVYPHQGDCTKNNLELGVSCFEKGDGIQQAINSVEENNEEVVTLLIEEGVYTREASEIIIISRWNSYYKVDYLINNKKINIQSVSGLVVLSGQENVPNDSIGVKGGSVEIQNIMFKNYDTEIESNNCRSLDRPCGKGLGVIAVESKNIWIKNCSFMDNRMGIGMLDIDVVKLINNTFINNLFAFDISYSNKLIIQNNLVEQNESGVLISGVSDVNVLNNFFINQTFTSIWFYSNANTSNVLIQNNLFLDCNQDVNEETPGCITVEKVDNIILRNNLFSNSREGVYIKEGFNPEIMNSDYNLFYQNSGKNYTNIKKGEHDIFGKDPGFINTEQDDYHLSDGSPAIDAGDPDIKDPDGSRSDIGVYGGPLGCEIDDSGANCPVEYILIDLNRDEKIDGKDYKEFIDNWIEFYDAGNFVERSDISKDGKIDGKDYKKFIDEWASYFDSK